MAEAGPVSAAVVNETATHPAHEGARRRHDHRSPALRRQLSIVRPWRQRRRLPVAGFAGDAPRLDSEAESHFAGGLDDQITILAGLLAEYGSWTVGCDRRARSFAATSSHRSTNPRARIPDRARSARLSSSAADGDERQCAAISTNPAATSRAHSSRSCIARRRSARRLTRPVPTGGTSMSTYRIPGCG